METTKMTIEKGLDLEDVVYIHNAIGSNMDGTRESHPE